MGEAVSRATPWALEALAIPGPSWPCSTEAATRPNKEHHDSLSFNWNTRVLPPANSTHLVLDSQFDRCRPAFASAHGERVTRQPEIERVPAIADAHVEARQLLR